MSLSTLRAEIDSYARCGDMKRLNEILPSLFSCYRVVTLEGQKQILLECGLCVASDGCLCTAPVPLTSGIDEVTPLLWSVSLFLPERSARALCMASKSFSSLLQKDVNERFAAERIQRFWKFVKVNRTTKIICSDFDLLGLNVENVRRIPFEQFVPTFGKKYPPQLAKRVLVRIINSSKAFHQVQGIALGVRFSARTFVVAFMICAYPNQVFEEYNVREHTLAIAAGELVSSFEDFLRDVKSFGSIQMIPGVSEKLYSLVSKLVTYEAAFVAWKGPDARKLCTRIANALDAMCAASVELHSRPFGPDVAATLAQIEVQTLRLRNKMRDISGQIALDNYDNSRMDMVTVAIVRALDIDGKYDLMSEEEMDERTMEIFDAIHGGGLEGGDDDDGDSAAENGSDGAPDDN